MRSSSEITTSAPSNPADSAPAATVGVARPVERDVGAVFGEEHRRARRERGVDVRDDGQRLVVDDDELRGVDSRRNGGGDDRRDPLAHVAHDAGCERRLCERLGDQLDLPDR